MHNPRDNEALVYWRTARHFRLTGDPEARDDLEVMAIHTENPRIRKRCLHLLEEGQACGSVA